MDRPPPRRRELVAWLVAQTRPLLPPLAIATLARIAGQMLGVAVLLTAAGALVRLSEGRHPSLLALGAAIAGISLVKAGLRYLEHYAGHWVAFAALQRLRELLFARLVPQAPAATTGRASAEVTERATRDIDRIEVFFAHTVPPVVASVVVPALALGWFALAVNPVPAAIIAVPLAAALLLPFLAARPSWAASRAQLAARGDLAAHVADDIQGIREVLAFEAEEQRLGSLADRQTEVSRTQARTGRVIATRAAIDRVLWGIALVGILVAGAPAADTAMGIALLAGLWLAGPGTDDFATGLDAALAACARVRGVAEARPIVADTGDVVPATTGAPAVAVENLTFRYPGAVAPALRGVTLRVSPGEWCYIAGVSGSGKSTLAALLTRTWDPDAGSIALDDVPLPCLSLDALRSAVAVVDQRAVLFPGTVAENLRLARPEAPEPDLLEALRVAGLPAEALPEGLETEVGERGSALSGGQLQRVAIARALVARPRLLVLDEALSQLDADTASTVRERLAGLADPLTIVEITHRTDVIPDEAEVAVVDRGEIVEQGQAGRLRAGGEAFARLSLRA